jgi:hypothetical protein
MRWSLELHYLDGKERIKTVDLSAACEGDIDLFVLLSTKQPSIPSSSISSEQREVAFRQSMQSRTRSRSSKPYAVTPSSELEEGEISDPGPFRPMRKRGNRAKHNRKAINKADPAEP